MIDDSFVRGIRGPIGSAKSSTCVMEVFRRICEQAPEPRTGKRRSRWAVIRNTYAELRETTIKTWCDWLPEETFGQIMMHPPPYRQDIRFNDVEAEILFMALDRPEDVKKLLSLELTGAWINEAREIPKTIVDAVTSRLRRYPSMKDGGASWSGLIMDTNSPDDDHWWPIMSGEAPPPEGMSVEEQMMLVKPANWKIMTQPPAMLEVFENNELVGYELNPAAENLENLHPDYYPQLITGKTRNWISVYVLNRIGADFDGRQVHPRFREEVHSVHELEPMPGQRILFGADFGLTPGGCFLQRVNGQWLGLGEIVLDNADAGELADKIHERMAEWFPGYQLTVYGDPAGDHRVGTDKRTPFQVLRTKGLTARPVETNDPSIRRAALANPLGRMIDGKPGIVFDRRRCPTIIRGLAGGWHYRQIKTEQGIRYSDEPDKNRYSHPCEGTEYGLMGGGEGRVAIGRQAQGTKQVNARVHVDPLDRLKRPQRTRARLKTV